MTSRQVDWRDQRYVQALGEELHHDNVSSPELARRLSTRFTERDFTKHVIIGALNREHVLVSLRRLFPNEIELLLEKYRSGAPNSSRYVYKKPSTQNGKAMMQRAPSKRARATMPGFPTIQTKKPVYSDVIPVLEPLRNQDGVATQVLTLRDDLCRFPIGDPQDKDFAFCGRMKVRGGYCSYHAQIAYRPSSTEKHFV